MSDNFSMMRMITGGLAYFVKEDKLLYDALQEHLGREPQVGDIAKCVMSFRRDRPDEYLFSYGNDQLGKVKKGLHADFDFESGMTSMVYEVCFYPFKNSPACPTQNK